jgi:hypothetical protein
MPKVNVDTIIILQIHCAYLYPFSNHYYLGKSARTRHLPLSGPNKDRRGCATGFNVIGYHAPSKLCKEF